MKTKEQIEEFLKKRCLCNFCLTFQKELSEIYQTDGLNGANNYIKNYEGMICFNLSDFLFFS